MSTAIKCDAAPSQKPLCRVCGKLFEGRSNAKSCSDACRKKRSRRKQEWEHTAIRVRKEIEQLQHANWIDSMTNEEAAACIDYLKRSLGRWEGQIRIKQKM